MIKSTTGETRVWYNTKFDDSLLVFNSNFLNSDPSYAFHKRWFLFVPCMFLQFLLCQCDGAMCLLTFTAKASSDLVHAPSSQKSTVIPSLVPPARPEEDILFQWRLRRKIEQAREWPQSLQHSSLHGPAFSWQASSLSHPSASGHPYKVGVSVWY